MTTPARRAAARRTVAYLRRQAGFDAPRLPPLDELLELAEAYVAEVGDGSEGSLRPTLGETGQVFVAIDPARAFGAEERLTDEAARQDLTELLLDAKQSESEPGLWRVRRRSHGLDISARVRQVGRLLVVEQISARPANVGGGRRG